MDVTIKSWQLLLATLNFEPEPHNWIKWPLSCSLLSHCTTTVVTPSPFHKKKKRRKTRS